MRIGYNVSPWSQHLNMDLHLEIAAAILDIHSHHKSPHPNIHTYSEVTINDKPRVYHYGQQNVG